MAGTGSRNGAGPDGADIRPNTGAGASISPAFATPASFPAGDGSRWRTPAKPDSDGGPGPTGFNHAGAAPLDVMPPAADGTDRAPPRRRAQRGPPPRRPRRRRRPWSPRARGRPRRGRTPPGPPGAGRRRPARPRGRRPPAPRGPVGRRRPRRGGRLAGHGIRRHPGISRPGDASRRDRHRSTGPGDVRPRGGGCRARQTGGSRRHPVRHAAPALRHRPFRGQPAARDQPGPGRPGGPAHTGTDRLLPGAGHARRGRAGRTG
jgi:hypothetical protein